MFEETTEGHLFESFYEAVSRGDLQSSYMLVRLLCEHYDSLQVLKKLNLLKKNIALALPGLPAIPLNQLIFATRYLKNPTGLRLYLDQIHAYTIAELSRAYQSVLEYLCELAGEAIKEEEKTDITGSSGGAIGDTKRMEHLGPRA